jgi:IS5 family transposase
LLKSGTIVDATIISAPSSTKNKDQARDPEMRQTKKGKNYYFGMKVHVGADAKGVVHSLTVTHAAEADINQMPELLHGEEQAIYGDKAYWCQADREAYEEIGIRYRVNRRGARGRPLSERWKKINRSRSGVRARGETTFLITKRWGFGKVRYRGLAKNRTRAFATYALANLYMVRHRLMHPGAKCLQ